MIIVNARHVFSSDKENRFSAGEKKLPALNLTNVQKYSFLENNSTINGELMNSENLYIKEYIEPKKL